MAKVFLVTINDVLQGVFSDEDIANKFASHFVDSVVESEELVTTMPDLYGWQCEVNLKEGAPRTSKCELKPDPVLLQLEPSRVLALGKTPEDAEENAGRGVAFLQTCYGAKEPAERYNSEFEQHSKTAKETGIPGLSPVMQQALDTIYSVPKRHKKHKKDCADPVEAATEAK